MATLAVACGLLFTAPWAQAERYLTVGQARHLCFPKADQFTEEKLQLTVEQSKAIARKAGHKAPALTARCWVARHDTNVLGVLFLDHALGKHELIDYAVAVTAPGRVLQVEILEYREHYGAQITNAAWRAQFTGRTTAAKLKLSDDIYNLSGATLSCRAVTDGVRHLLAVHDVVVRPRLADAGGLPDAAARGP